jgi:hypothetical protein
MNPVFDQIVDTVRNMPWTPFLFPVNLMFHFFPDLCNDPLLTNGTIYGYRILDAIPRIDDRNPVEYMVKACYDNLFVSNLFARLAPSMLGTFVLPFSMPVPASNRLAMPKFNLSTDANEFIIVDPNYKKKLQTVHYIVASILINSHVPCPFLLDQRTAIASLSRLLIDAPTPTVHLNLGWQSHCAKWVPLLLRLWQHRSVKDWLDHIPSTKKREIFTQALKELEENGYVSSVDNLMEHFIKDEKSVYDDEDGTSRPIISMRPKKMAAYGKFFYELGLTMKLLWSSEWFVRNRIYFGSQNAEDIGRAFDNLMDYHESSGFWIMVNGDDSCIFVLKDGKWHIYKNDMSRMDGHVRKEHLLNENEFYHMLRMPALAKIAVRDITAKVRSRYGLFVKMTRRLSGSGQTTVGNTNQNIVCVNHCFTESDGSIAQLQARANEMGFTAKFAICPNIYDLEFCSKLFWPTRDGTVLGAKVGRMMKKIGTMKITKHTLSDYKAAVNAHYNDNYFVPVVNVTLKRILDLMRDVKLGKVDYEEEFKIHVSKRHEPTTETWLFFECRYGVSKLMVDGYTEQLMAITSLPVNIRVDWMESVFDRDGA